MKFEILIRHIFSYCNEKGVTLCVLRNYHHFPQENISNDIDLLCQDATLVFVRGMFEQLEDVYVTAYCERYYVVSVFLYGIEWGDKKKAIQIDFVRHLCWKGLPYIDKRHVLDMAVPIREECAWIRIPRPEHEAIISLFSSYLIGGWIKDRYQEKIREVFFCSSKDVCSELSVFFQAHLAYSLVNSTIDNDRAKMMILLPKIRRSLLIRSLAKSPFSLLFKVINYYFAELTICYSKELRFDVCLLGPDGAGKTMVTHHLLNKLQNSAKSVEAFHFRPKTTRDNMLSMPVMNPHAMPTRSYTLSVVKLAYFAVLYITDRWFRINDKRNSVLYIWDRYYHDILADPKRYRMGAPAWLVRLFGRLIPKPDLFLILDVCPEVARTRKIEVSEAENERQFHAYRALAKELPNAVLIDANYTPEEVATSCEHEIVKVMVRRLDERMGWSQRGSDSL